MGGNDPHSCCLGVATHSAAHGPWSLVPGPWSIVRGPWSVVPGPWSQPLPLVSLVASLKSRSRETLLGLIFLPFFVTVAFLSFVFVLLRMQRRDLTRS